MTKRKTREDYYHDPKAPKPTTRPPSVSVVVRNDDGAILLIQRTDNRRWAIPGGKLDLGESVPQAGLREVKEETGLDIEITGMVGVFSDPGHVIVYRKGGKVKEVRQPCNICLHARPIGGKLSAKPDEASEVRWVNPVDLAQYDIHPAIRLRIDHGLNDVAPYIG